MITKSQLLALNKYEAEVAQMVYCLGVMRALLGLSHPSPATFNKTVECREEEDELWEKAE